jgi:hypothetical protein
LCALSIGSENERAFACTDQNSDAAHSFVGCGTSADDDSVSSARNFEAVSECG